MTRLDKFALAMVFGVALYSLMSQWRPADPDPGPGRRPLPEAEPPAVSVLPPALERVRRPLAEPGALDPLAVINVENRIQHGSGTAFAAHARGLWLTARHVVDGCREVYLSPAPPFLPAAVVYVHPSADVAVLASPRSGPVVQFADEPLDVGQDGFGFGYPQGKLGAAHVRLMGRSRTQFTGRMSGVTPTLIWAEVRREPDTLESLGGISGGPVFDEHGRLVGIHIGGSARRGRTITVAPELIRQMRHDLPDMDLLAGGEPVAEFRVRHDDLAALTRSVSRQARIAMVLCLAPN